MTCATPVEVVRLTRARTGSQPVGLRSPWPSGSLGRLLAIGGSIYFAFNPVALSADSADRADESAASYLNPVITVAAISPAQLHLDTIAESVSHLDKSVSQPEEVSTVQCVKSQDTSDPALVLEPDLQPKDTVASSPEETHVSADADMAGGDRLEWAFSRPEAAQETSVASTTGSLSPPRTEKADGDDLFSTRYLERRPANESAFQGLLGRARAGNGFSLSTKFQVGYGGFFQDNTVLARGNNGTGREEPSRFFLRTCFRF